MSMQALEINKNTVFKAGQGLYWTKIDMGDSMKLAVLAHPEEGSNPSASTIVEVPSPPSQATLTVDISGVEFNKGGVISTSTFTSV